MGVPSYCNIGVVAPKDLQKEEQIAFVKAALKPWKAKRGKEAEDEWVPSEGIEYEYIFPLKQVDFAGGEYTTHPAEPMPVAEFLDGIIAVQEQADILGEFQERYIVAPIATQGLDEEAATLRCVFAEFRVSPPVEAMASVRSALPYSILVTPDGKWRQRVSSRLVQIPQYKTYSQWWSELIESLTPYRDTHVIVPVMLG